MTLKLIFVSKAALIEVFEGHHKTLKPETDFRILRFVSQKTQSDRKNDPKPLKPTRTQEVRNQKAVAKGFFEPRLEVLAGFEAFSGFRG